MVIVAMLVNRYLLYRGKEENIHFAALRRIRKHEERTTSRFETVKPGESPQH